MNGLLPLDPIVLGACRIFGWKAARMLCDLLHRGIVPPRPTPAALRRSP
jgi:hypothetical protein